MATSSRESPLNLEPGTTIAHYTLIEKIGEGGMGIVYRALDAKLNRHVAIKFLPQELTSDPERRMRFQREAQAAAALNHPGIAVIHEVSEHDGTPFIVMEYLEGQSLRHAIEGRSLSTKEWIRLALPIAEALAHAHRRGIVHRDLKPDNVRVTPDGQVKILDFGLAKLLEPEKLPSGADPNVHTQMDTISRQLTHAGKVFGTVNYMSPEQARGEAVDHRSDVFSFGIMLYQMAAGKLPFQGKTDIETLNGILNHEPPAVTGLVTDAPPDVERVVRKAMEKEPGRRYQHADELATDLKNLERDLDSGRTSTIRAAARRGLLSGRRVAIIAVAAITVIAVAALLLLRGGSGLRSANAANRTIGVMGFENLSDSDDAENLGRVLMGLVTTDLAESGGLQVVSTSKVLGAVREASGGERRAFDAAIASSAARLAGADVMLVGQMSQVGSRMLLTAELVEVKSGRTLGSLKQEAASSAELFTLAGAIAEDVRNSVGVKQGTADEGFDLARTLTGSPDAYRSYAEGQVALHEGGYAKAVQLFSRAVQKDSTFALAAYRLGLAHSWNGDVDECKIRYAQALRHADRLPDRWRITIQGEADYHNGKFDEAYASLTRLVRSGDALPDTYNSLAEVVTHASKYHDPREARALFEKALEIDPTFKVVFFHLMEDYMRANDLAACERLLARYRNDNPADGAVKMGERQLLHAQKRFREAAERYDLDNALGHQVSPLLQAYALIEAGDADRAATVASEAMQSNAGYRLGMAHWARANAKVARGSIRSSLDDFDQGAALHEHAWSTSTRSAITAQKSQALFGAGDLRGARREAERAVAIDPFAGFAHYALARVLAEMELGAELSSQTTRLEALSKQGHSPLLKFWVHLMRAEQHLLAGSPSRAKAEMDQATSMRNEYRDIVREFELQARVHAALGDRPAAITAYRGVLDPPRLYRAWDSGRIPVLYELARLEEAEGDIAAAREHYGQYLGHWGDADVPIPNIAEARKRLKALGGA